VCTYITEQLEVNAVGKGAAGWFRVTDAVVYFDHPSHHTDTHTLNIDFRNPSQGAPARVAVELSRESALELAAAVQRVLAAVPEGVQ
jgi:hypothetical protein